MSSGGRPGARLRPESPAWAPLSAWPEPWGPQPGDHTQSGARGDTNVQDRAHLPSEGVRVSAVRCCLSGGEEDHVHAVPPAGKSLALPQGGSKEPGARRGDTQALSQHLLCSRLRAKLPVPSPHPTLSTGCVLHSGLGRGRSASPTCVPERPRGHTGKVRGTTLIYYV